MQHFTWPQFFSLIMDYRIRYLECCYLNRKFHFWWSTRIYYCSNVLISRSVEHVTSFFLIGIIVIFFPFNLAVIWNIFRMFFRKVFFPNVSDSLNILVFRTRPTCNVVMFVLSYRWNTTTINRNSEITPAL